MELRKGEPTTPASGDDSSEHRILHAAAALMRERGPQGVTIAEIARGAGVSRPTIYRRWAGVDDVIRAVLLQAVQRILESFAHPADTRTAIVEDVLRFSQLFRDDELYGALLARHPEVFTRYTLLRIGESQRVILSWLAAAIELAQRDGSVRKGDPSDIAVMLLLIAQSAILSRSTVAALIDEEHWRTELWHALDGHLRP